MSNNLLFDSTRIVNRRKKRAIIYFIIFIVAFVLWFPGTWPNQNSFSLLGGEVGVLINRVKNSFTGREDDSPNNKLEKQNLALMQENASLKEKIRDNSIQFGIDSVKTDYTIVEARVIGKDSFFDIPLLHLLAGTDKGLREGLPVLDPNGVLIGTIKESQEKISQVVLTPNHESRVGAKIAGSDWDGVVEGNRDLRAVLEMLPLESRVKEGDQVVTDNRNPNIPEDLIIGSVGLIKESDDHLFNQAVLDLPWDSNNLDKVWVIVGRK